MTVQLSEAEYQLLHYLRDPENPRVPSEMAKAVGIHRFTQPRCEHLDFIQQSLKNALESPITDYLQANFDL
jgi:hypothetical protein